MRIFQYHFFYHQLQEYIDFWNQYYVKLSSIYLCVDVLLCDTRIVHSFKYWMDIEKCLLLLNVGRKLCRLWGVQKLPIFLSV